MLDFEETTKALMILEEKDSQKALELGKDIIKNNKGDDYLQATVWNVFFFDNQTNYHQYFLCNFNISIIQLF